MWVFFEHHLAFDCCIESRYDHRNSQKVPLEKPISKLEGLLLPDYLSSVHCTPLAYYNQNLDLLAAIHIEKLFYTRAAFK